MNKAEYRTETWSLRQTLRLCFVIAGGAIVLATAYAITGIAFSADLQGKNLLYTVLLTMSGFGIGVLFLADCLIGQHFKETVNELPIL